MAFMNFFKNENEREDISEEDDKPIGGFNNWKDALESMKNDQVNKHKENDYNKLIYKFSEDILEEYK